MIKMGIKIIKSVIKKQKYLDKILKKDEKENPKRRRHKFQNLIDRLEIKKKEELKVENKNISRFIQYVRKLKVMK